MTRSIILGLVVAAAACAAPSDEEASASHLASMQTLFADATKLDLSDLTRLTVGFATDALNDQLSAQVGPFSAGVRFDAPAVFGVRAEPSSLLPASAEVKGLDAIVTGLATRFGETELGTRVNRVRLEHLEGTADDFFVESGFTVQAGFGPSWSFAAPGFADATTTLGFDANAALSSRVIVATGGDGLRDLVSAPLAALKSMRGFVYPRSVDDVRTMKPGEMFALRGAGKLGANFGVGAPIFVADPVGPLAYRVVVSAGVAGVISGQIDVQLVKLPGDEVVVDLGVENGRGVTFRAGIADAWGIKGLCDDGRACLRPIELAGRTIDLSKLVGNAIVGQLDRYLTFHVEASSGTSSSRVSLSRFRLHLDRGEPSEVSRALEQLLKFDLRLAQALANRDLAVPEPAITADFDAVRAATTATRNFGFEVLGMNVYHRNVVDREGTFVLQTPEGAKAILFDHLSKNAGWFQQEHGFTRTAVAAKSVNAARPTELESAASLYVQTMSADRHMGTDFVLDTVDGLLLGVAGAGVVDTLDAFGNDLERTLWKRCPVEEGENGSTHGGHWDERCNVSLLDDPAFTDRQFKGMAALDAKIAGLPSDLKDLVRAAALVRLTQQSVGVHDLDVANGPEVSLTTDVRFDDVALDRLTSRSKADYLAALRAYVGSTHSPRRDVHKPADKVHFGGIAEGGSHGAVEAMATAFERDARAYRAILDAERALPQKLAGKAFVQAPLGIRFTVAASEVEMLRSAVLRSTTQERALAAARLYDDLRAEADGLRAGLHEEHAALFPLVALAGPANLEVAFRLDADVSSSFFVKRRRFEKAGYRSVAAGARGPDVVPLGAGMFDIQAIAAASP